MNGFVEVEHFHGNCTESIRITEIVSFWRNISENQGIGTYIQVKDKSPFRVKESYGDLKSLINEALKK